MSDSTTTRTVITVSRHTLERLRKAAAERQMSMSALIREALEEKVDEAQPFPTCIGVGNSGQGNLAQRSADERMEPRPWR